MRAFRRHYTTARVVTEEPRLNFAATASRAAYGRNQVGKFAMNIRTEAARVFSHFRDELK
jgi:hypothetical protein